MADFPIPLTQLSFRQAKQSAGALIGEFRLLWRVAKHPEAPWRARLIALCATAYLASPVQVIPTFIPVIGQLDDVLVIYLAAKWINRILPPAVLAGCRAGVRSIE